MFASLGRLCHGSFIFSILRASRVLEAWFRLKTMTVVDALSFLLIQTDAPGYWNRTDVSPLYGKSPWEQLCMSNFACYEILIPPFFCHLEQSTVFYPHVRHEISFFFSEILKLLSSQVNLILFRDPSTDHTVQH